LLLLRLGLLLRGRCGRLLLAVASAPASAAALRLRLFARCRRGRRLDYGLGLCSALNGRAFLALFAPEPLQQKKTPCSARALASPDRGRSACSVSTSKTMASA